MRSLKPLLAFVWLVSVIHLQNTSAKTIDFDAQSFDGNLHLNTKGVAVESRTQEVYKVGQVFSFGIENRFSQSFSGILNAGLVMEAGSNNSSFNANYRPITTLYLSEIKIRWAPSYRFNMEAGAISMGHYEIPLLLSGSAFIGLKEYLALYEGRNISVFIDAIQSIPNNYTLAQRYGDVDQEGTPQFYLERLNFEIGDSQSTLWKGFVGHFLFTNLSSPVAFNSRLGGNSTTTGNINNTNFLYGFQGWVSGTSLGFNVNKMLRLRPYIKYLFNNKAPDGRNEGVNAGLDLTFFGKSHNISPSFEYFLNESDSSPAFYNSKFYGNNNNEGVRLGLNVEDKKREFEYYINYFDFSYLRTTSPGIWQADTQVFTLGVRTSYELF